MTKVIGNMNVIEFKKLLNKRIALTEKVLTAKNKEYATDLDKCHNFKRAGAMLGIEPEQALVGMWTKHIISILDIVNKIHKQRVSKEMLEEKIGDAINYLILLEALIKERYKYD